MLTRLGMLGRVAASARSAAASVAPRTATYTSSSARKGRGGGHQRRQPAPGSASSARREAQMYESKLSHSDAELFELAALLQEHEAQPQQQGRSNSKSNENAPRGNKLSRQAQAAAEEAAALDDLGAELSFMFGGAMAGAGVGAGGGPGVSFVSAASFAGGTVITDRPLTAADMGVLFGDHAADDAQHQRHARGRSGRRLASNRYGRAAADARAAARGEFTERQVARLLALGLSEDEVLALEPALATHSFDEIVRDITADDNTQHQHQHHLDDDDDVLVAELEAMVETARQAGASAGELRALRGELDAVRRMRRDADVAGRGGAKRTTVREKRPAGAGAGAGAGASAGVDLSSVPDAEVVSAQVVFEEETRRSSSTTTTTSTSTTVVIDVPARSYSTSTGISTGLLRRGIPSIVGRRYVRAGRGNWFAAAMAQHQQHQQQHQHQQEAAAREAEAAAAAAASSAWALADAAETTRELKKAAAFVPQRAKPATPTTSTSTSTSMDAYLAEMEAAAEAAAADAVTAARKPAKRAAAAAADNADAGVVGAGAGAGAGVDPLALLRAEEAAVLDADDDEDGAGSGADTDGYESDYWHSDAEAAEQEQQQQQGEQQQQEQVPSGEASRWSASSYKTHRADAAVRPALPPVVWDDSNAPILSDPAPALGYVKDRFRARSSPKLAETERKVRLRDSYVRFEDMAEATLGADGTQALIEELGDNPSLTFEERVRAARGDDNRIPDSAARGIGGERIASLDLDEGDLIERYVRGSGPGGQSVNKTRNCVFLQHAPTGTVVKCHQTRSLFENRAIARKIMKRKLEELKMGRDSYLGRKQERIRRRKSRNRRRYHGKVDEDDGAGAGAGPVAPPQPQ